MLERARNLGVELERRPAERIVITGFAQITPLGGTEETWQGLLDGRSGVRKFDVGNFRTNIAAPVKFNAGDHFSERDQKRLSNVAAMAIVASREAGTMAGLLGDDGRLRDGISRDRVGSWISSGIAGTQYLIDVHGTIHEKDETGREDPVRGSRRINPFLGLKVFPEQMNGQVTIALAISGWGGNTIEACATGAANIVEGARTIKTGDADIVFAGGAEDPLSHHGDVGIGIFASMRAVSARNDRPEQASRPFDRDRDGFVPGAGVGVVVLENLEHALNRGATIYAEVLGFEKSMDGRDPTELDSERVARTIFKALYNAKSRTFYRVDAIFAHATSTIVGDVKEAEALRLVFGDGLPSIPITAIKSAMGHLGGGVGAVNVVVAVQAMDAGLIPHILNLENPGEGFADLNLVRGQPRKQHVGTVLATAYGFGGYNAVLVLGEFQG